MTDPTDLEKRRLAALTAAVRTLPGVTLKVPTLERAGVNTVVVLWPPGVDPLPAVAALIAGWDWTEQADKLSRRGELKAALQTSADTQLGVLVRALASLTRKGINQVRTNPTQTFPAVSADAWRDMLLAEIDSGSGD